MWQKDSIVYYQDFTARLETVSYGYFFLVAVLVGYLFFIQCIKGGYYYELSQKNRLYILPERAPRGDIIDCKGRPLASDVTRYGVVFYPFAPSGSSMPQTIKKIADITGIPQKFVARSISDSLRSGRLANISIALKREQLFALKEEQDSLPGVAVTKIPERVYSAPLIERNSHLLGYLGEADPSFLEQYGEMGYSRGDIVGKSGIEALYDHYLRGESGGWQIEVDAIGHQRRFLNYIAPRRGYNLRLFVDDDLQKTAYEEIARSGSSGGGGGGRGAAVAIEPATGKVRLFVSVPGYNSQEIYSISGSSSRLWEELLNSPAKPLLNRASSGLYPPGSVFKIITFTTALLEGVPDETSYYCRGKFDYGSRTFKCWKKEGHGRLDLKGGFVNSCNVYFYNLGLRLGADKILNTARIFNLGKKTNADVKSEKSGYIPSEKDFEKILSERSLGGESINLAIGQGTILVTPLQMAQMAAAIAARGKVMRPIIADAAFYSDGDLSGGSSYYEGGKKNPGSNFITINKPSDNYYEIKLPSEVWDKIISAMEGVVSEGTGRAAYMEDLGIKVAGKTGTAQNPHGKDHAWFVCFASKKGDGNSDDEKIPDIALAVLVENGGSGGAVAAPIARKILEKYFEVKDNKTNEIGGEWNSYGD